MKRVREANTYQTHWKILKDFDNLSFNLKFATELRMKSSTQFLRVGVAPGTKMSMVPSVSIGRQGMDDSSAPDTFIRCSLE